jgi:hypothetical protein
MFKPHRLSTTQHNNKAKRYSVEDQSLDDDDVCMAEFCSPTNHTSSFLDFFGCDESFGRLSDITDFLPVESDYSCFTTSQ